MTFDNSPPLLPSRWEATRSHLPLLVVVLGAVGFAAGIHLASTAVAVIAASHLVLAVILLGVRALLGVGKRGGR